MAPQHDLEKPMDDPYSLVGDSWPSESENSYHTAKVAAEDASTAASVQSESATDAGSKMGDEHGKTADTVSGGYGAAATELMEQARNFTTISAWMEDAAVKVLDAKRHIRHLVRTATSEIRDALASELSGTAVTPSSADLIVKYRDDISSVTATLSADLDSIGHSLAGDRGASRTPSYVSVPTTPTPEHADPHAVAASYTGAQGAPAPEPQKLPEMPRASATTPESPSTPATPAPTANPHAVNPTLSNLISGASPSGTRPSPSAKSSSGPTSGIPAGQGAQAHQPSEQRQQIRPPALPRIPLSDLPAAATSIATTVTSSVGHQLATTAPTSPGSSIPASTGITPGVSGTPPVPPAPPGGLAPVGGGLPTSPVQPAPPVSQATPPAPTAAPAPSPQSPAPARGPVVDAAWLQRTYGLAPGLDLPKSETDSTPALFITELPEPEAHLHKILATLRHAFDDAGWGQPLAVASIRRGFERQTVYVTADALSIHPAGILLPHGVLPLDEMPNGPATYELSGSLMVTDKLAALIPREWTVESLLSTVSGGEGSQSIEQYQELVDAGELLPCKVSRGRDDVTDDEALSTFARAAIGSAGCGEVEAEGGRLRGARWVGTQPQGYLDVLSRYYLSDAAEQMSLGRWGEAVWASEKYMSIALSKTQAA
ncbi:hypothetical protein [Mycobacteroides abscessus]|uniref:hypothetical protein n=1 Tax=Mycobacteroides abscessus TaxID=36809 RepID=UPI001927AADC|nr:hypothetical protein [Mycobacteroides abscessus]MBL3752692.1 hypothetical protein [Mycobacteroides abscessus subsp. massiliense]